MDDIIKEELEIYIEDLEERIVIHQMKIKELKATVVQDKKEITMEDVTKKEMIEYIDGLVEQIGFHENKFYELEGILRQAERELEEMN